MKEIGYAVVAAVLVYIVMRLCIRGWWNDKTRHDLEVLGNHIESESEESEK